MTAEELAPLLYFAAMRAQHPGIPEELPASAWEAMSPEFTGKWLAVAAEAVARLDPPRLYGLTAAEWLHLAAEGEGSEVQPCCGNLGQLRELLNALATFQSPDDTGWQLSVGRHVLEVLEGDGDGHDLSNREAHPLLARVLDGIRAQQADPDPFGLREKESA